MSAVLLTEVKNFNFASWVMAIDSFDLNILYFPCVF